MNHEANINFKFSRVVFVGEWWGHRLGYIYGDLCPCTVILLGIADEKGRKRGESYECRKLAKPMGKTGNSKHV